jgi:hypothetical protein
MGIGFSTSGDGNTGLTLNFGLFSLLVLPAGIVLVSGANRRLKEWPSLVLTLTFPWSALFILIACPIMGRNLPEKNGGDRRRSESPESCAIIAQNKSGD